MKNTIVRAFLLCAVSLIARAQHPFMTFNIRLATPTDGINQWENRKDRVAETILWYDTHILGVQEALHNQMLDLQARLPEYAWVGVGRDDGKAAGEYSAIFYKKAVVEVLETQTFWLSETPQVPSFGWDAKIRRVVTWAKFQEKVSGKVFYVFNTHFDHQGVVARRESAKLLKKKVTEIAGNVPAVVMGDFNAAPAQEPIQIMVGDIAPNLKEARLASKSKPFGPTGTFNGFQARETSDEPIDHIFITPSWRVHKFGTLSPTWKGLFASDHFAVIAWLELP